jgi:hypothetical protein
MLIRRPTPRAASLLSLCAVALTGLAACADGPVAPVADAPSADAPAPSATPSHAVLSAPTTARVLTRATPLSRAVSVSAVIGSAGGVMTVPMTGLTLTVPAGAVRVPTTFTISAPAGAGVWYEFGPSGAKFDVPLTITQDLRGTNAAGIARSAFEGAYFVDGTRNESTKSARVTEVLPVTFNGTGTALSFKVTHFSGYMVSTGRTSYYY